MSELKNLRVLKNTGCMLGEGPLYCAGTEGVYWVDIIGTNLHYIGLDGESYKQWNFKSKISSINKRSSGGYIITLREGFAFWSPENPLPQLILSPESTLTKNRYNDAKTDSAGRLWAGTMDDEEQNETGKLYRLDSDLKYHEMDAGYIITNGPAFSPSGDFLYHTDTLSRTIYRFSMTRDGSIGGKQPFINIEKKHGYPDGMTVSTDGDIWVCHFAGARISRFDSSGNLKTQYDMPVSNITSCAFVGKNLDRLVITTARKNLNDLQLHKEPDAGSLFIADIDTSGIPVTPFAG